MVLVQSLMYPSIFRASLRTARDELNALDKKYDKSEDDLKAVQNVGQIIGEVLKQLDDERSTARLTNRIDSQPVFWFWFALFLLVGWL